MERTGKAYFVSFPRILLDLQKPHLITSEQPYIEAEIAEQTAKLKALKADLKKATKKLQGYEEQKALQEAAAAAAAAKEALSEKIDELLNDGMSLEDILEKLK